MLKNDIQLFPIGLSVGLGHLREGKLTALAVAASQRLRMIPGVPTMTEVGFPGFTASNWWGMAGPAGTPDDIADTLYKAVAGGIGDATGDRALPGNGHACTGDQRGSNSRQA